VISDVDPAIHIVRRRTKSSAHMHPAARAMQFTSELVLSIWMDRRGGWGALGFGKSDASSYSAARRHIEDWNGTIRAERDGINNPTKKRNPD